VARFRLSGWAELDGVDSKEVQRRERLRLSLGWIVEVICSLLRDYVRGKVVGWWSEVGGKREGGGSSSRF
jgi:hypothetical protein